MKSLIIDAWVLKLKPDQRLSINVMIKMLIMNLLSMLQNFFIRRRGYRKLS